MPAATQIPQDERLTSFLDTGAIATFFQPVVSLRRKALVAVEALSRGRMPGTTLPAPALFGLPGSAAERQALDKLCRRSSLEAFGPLRERMDGLALFVNLCPDCLPYHLANVSHATGQTERAGLSPSGILLEVPPTAEPDVLHNFLAAHQAAGFRVSLDNMGARSADFELLEHLAPDVVKLSPQLCSGVHSHPARRELVLGLLRLASSRGAVAVACGTENMEDVLALAELGVDLFQGHAFAKAVPKTEALPDLGHLLEHAAHQFRDHCVRRLATRRERHKVYAILAEELLQELSAPQADMEASLNAAVANHPMLVCAYVLTGSGLQISSSVRSQVSAAEAPGPGVLQTRADKGADHSSCEYYLALGVGLARYTTDAALSPASGRLVRTISAAYTDATGRDRVLCLDMDAAYDA